MQRSRDRTADPVNFPQIIPVALSGSRTTRRVCNAVCGTCAVFRDPLRSFVPVRVSHARYVHMHIREQLNNKYTRRRVRSMRRAVRGPERIAIPADAVFNYNVSRTVIARRAREGRSLQIAFKLQHRRIYQRGRRRRLGRALESATIYIDVALAERNLLRRVAASPSARATR